MGKREGPLEGVGLSLFADIYRSRRVLVTGHTGFKGSWLALWLNELGAEVTGIALDPDTTNNHWDLLNLKATDCRHDIRDSEKLKSLIEAARPEIVFHLAAQSLVRRSYQKPLDTWTTNVIGTANVLDACRRAGSVKALVVTTTDKVYANQESPRGYCEDDGLGGHDPYSASKAACEILIESYRKSFLDGNNDLLLASARAGNAIGGGDWSEDRLIPDLVRAMEERKSLLIRSPSATRPWQHVLDCLAGYLTLGQRLLEGRRECAAAFNFGPDPHDNQTVAEVLGMLAGHWARFAWQQSTDPHPHESTLLHLDSSKARCMLEWRPVWSLAQTLEATATWYRGFYEERMVLSRKQLLEYTELARA